MINIFYVSFVLNKVSYTVEGSFISSNKIQCTTPRVNKSGDYYLEISEDGISYTYNQVIFSFYGNYNSLYFYPFYSLFCFLTLLKDDAHNDKAGVITGIVVLVALFSLTTTGVGVYFWRKRKEREHVDNAEASFSLLPGMKNKIIKLKKGKSH